MIHWLNLFFAFLHRNSFTYFRKYLNARFERRFSLLLVVQYLVIATTDVISHVMLHGPSIMNES